MFPQRPDYVSVNINDGTSFAKSTSRSIWRQWNQLSRFQRNILYFTVIAGIILLIYFLPGKTQLTTVVDESDYDSTKVAQEHQKVRKVQEKHEANHGDRGGGINVEVIEEPEFQPEANQVDNNQIGEPPQHQLQALKFNGPKNDRQKAVVQALMHSWNGYKKFAWGHDSVKPVSKSYHEWFGLGLTIVDSLDTLYMMGLYEEFKEGQDWVKKNLVFDRNRDVNLFELTIRVLGGLLSAYHLSGDKMFLEKAVELGDRTMPAFASPSGVPYSDVNLGMRIAHAPRWNPDSSAAEIASLQLEYRDLSRSSGQPRFEQAVAKVSEHLHQLEKFDGLVPIFINANTGLFQEHSAITLGARGDSYYEYLLKQWIQTGRTIDYLRDDYLLGLVGTEKHLVKRTAVNKHLFLAELIGASREVKPKMDHLTCFLSGTIVLGVHFGLPKEHLQLADELINTCWQTYAIQPTGLAPEITYFNIHNSNDKNQNDMTVKTNDAHNLLRPEFIESLYYMWYFTGNKTYQDLGWRIFQSFEKYSKVEHGYTSIGNVKNIYNTRPRDMTESFWFSETLKYFYLLFDDTRRLIDLEKWVFNTEGHPLPIYES
ncbi:endoplasmic reticulum mannosyl-oligosaccharide 1,2-alpha-mannosidase [Copidosoma floridanum]|uniref:endoplasmic reticulum mannosyl-oligosaccharide 1,2-alpha-mannosidase n=1 Tax=Copidosoma floridanum TaxID=29053 RepID=UPI0006C93C6B|nr:endoplasmic reticulum mannosyl-oligosaccharide 1,2-alpha-mannosidase [Copidosoma floridanum]